MHNIDDFDEFLRSRFIPQPSDTLEQRIIAQAAQTLQKTQMSKSGGVSLSGWFRGVFNDFFEDIMLPAPVFSFVVILFAGFYVGGQYSSVVVETVDVSSVSDALDEDIYSYFEIADNLDYGEFSGI